MLPEREQETMWKVAKGMKENWKQLYQASHKTSHLIQYIKAGKWTTTTFETRAVCHQMQIFKNEYNSAPYLNNTSEIIVSAMTVTW